MREDSSPDRSRRWLALGVAIPGVGLCIAAVLRFFARVAANNLPSNDREFFQEHYLAVGAAYSQAFVVGFFLCFFLVMIAVTIGNWVETRRARRKPSPSSVNS